MGVVKTAQLSVVITQWTCNKVAWRGCQWLHGYLAWLSVVTRLPGVAADQLERHLGAAAAQHLLLSADGESVPLGGLQQRVAGARRHRRHHQASVCDREDRTVTPTDPPGQCL